MLNNAVQTSEFFHFYFTHLLLLKRVKILTEEVIVVSEGRTLPPPKIYIFIFNTICSKN